MKLVLIIRRLKMYDFCPYCGRQLEAGEKCSFCKPRAPRSYEAPKEEYRGEPTSSYHTQSNYSNYGNHNAQYQEEMQQYVKQQQARTDKKNVITFSIIGMFIGAQAIMSCIGGFFALIFAGISLTFSIIANKKNKKLDTPIAVPKVALVISIIAIVADIIVGGIFFALQWGDVFTNFVS